MKSEMDKDSPVDIYQDSTERKRTETLLGGQRQVLEMIATGEPLPETLTALIQLIEAQSPGMLGSILLLDKDGVHVRHGAAPSLPAEFISAVDGQPIGPVAGSCGTAAYRKEAVFVEDIATDPLWESYKVAALPHGLRASWSTPIFDAQGQVLGTFAMYYRQPGLPKQEHLHLIDTATHIAAIAINRHRQEVGLRNSENRFSILFNHASLPAVLTRFPDHEIVDVNAAWLQLFGYTKEELIGSTSLAVGISRDAEHRKRTIDDIRQLNSVRNVEQTLFSKSGEAHTVLVNVNTVVIDGQDCAISSLQDITERKAAEAKVKRLAQLYAVLSQCNQAIVRCSNEAELLPIICRDAVNFGGMKMAWIGMVDPVSNLVKPVASFGAGIEYLNGVEISIRDNNSTGIGPTGTAIRDNQPYWCQDFQHDPATVAWHERGAQFGWGASASLPLHRNGIVVGAFGLYADVANAFDEAAQKLLVEMAMDISFALDNFDRENQRKLIQEENARLMERLEIATHAGKIGIWDWDIVSNKLVWDDRMFELYGTKREDFSGAYETWHTLLHPDDIAAANETLQRSLSSEIPYDTEFRVCWPNGKIRNLRALGQIMRNADGTPMRMIGVNYDITERKRAESNLRIAAAAFESQESIMITDANRVIQRVNQTFIDETGYTAEEVIGKTPRLLSSGRHKAAFYSAMWKTIHRTGTWQGEIWDRRKNGEIYPKWLTITAVKDAQGIVTHYVGSHTDISERKSAEKEIHLLAFYDPLTKLPNRRLLMDRFQHALVSSARTGRAGALLFIDLDNFKTLNDTLGHDIGDLLLQQVAHRLPSCVRNDDTVTRLGGDEFVVLLENLSEQPIEAAAQTEAIGEKILTALHQPYQLDAKEYQGTASIGATVFNGSQIATEELMKQADIAMYQAKKAGRNTLRFFDQQMQASITNRFSLEGELRKALENHEFHLHYQIQVDSASRPLGAEALIRWIHPLRGMVSPMEFIPLAEETGLILPIGQWVLETACAQLRAWQEGARTMDLALAVNVSAKQFHQPDFVTQVEEAVQRHGIIPRLLKLELTEGMLLDNIEETIATMNALKEIGIQFSLDDFGTGYSSLQYLKRLPLDQIKIDQSFVRDITSDPNDAAIVQTIIAMAETLGFDVIAEGVETEAQREFLELRGCTQYQGYLFSKPIPIEQFEALLKLG